MLHAWPGQDTGQAENHLSLQELVTEGLVKGIGLCEVSASDIRKAHAIHPITAIEAEWSLFSRDAEVWCCI